MSAPSRLSRIAIVGRPNVGKSTLLNRMCRSRVSIVEPTEGVTRDRVSVRALLPGFAVTAAKNFTVLRARACAAADDVRCAPTQHCYPC